MKNEFRIYAFKKNWYYLVSFQLILLVLVTFLISNLSADKRMTFMRIFSIFNLAYLLIYKASLSRAKNFDYNFFNELPFYLCNLGSFIAIIATFTSNQLLMGYCFTVGTWGAVLAFLMPDYKFVGCKLFSQIGIGYFGYHGLIFILNMCFGTLGFYQPVFADCFKMILLLAILLALVHLLNLYLRDHYYERANYIFTLKPTNIVLEKVYHFFPHPLFYLYLILPVVIPLHAIMCYLIYPVLKLIFPLI